MDQSKHAGGAKKSEGAALGGWPGFLADVENYPRAAGSLLHGGAAKAFTHADIPALNQALLDIGVARLIGKLDPAWCLTLQSVLDEAFAARGHGLAFEALPDFFRKLGVGLDEPVFGGRTLANVACWLDQDRLLSGVVDVVDVSQVDSAGRDLVEMCAQYGGAKCLNILMARGRDVDSPRAQGMTPLMIAASDHDAVVKMLATPKRCAQLDENGMSALSHACHRGRLKVSTVAMLCAMSEVDLVDAEGKTPLTRAIRHGQTKPERAGKLLPAFDPAALDYCFQAVAARADLSLASADGLLPEELCHGWFDQVPGGGDIGPWMKSQREARALGADLPAALPSVKRARM